MEASKLLNNDMFVFNYFTFGVLSYREQEYRLSGLKTLLFIDLIYLLNL